MIAAPKWVTPETKAMVAAAIRHVSTRAPTQEQLPYVVAALMFAMGHEVFQAGVGTPGVKAIEAYLGVQA